MHFHSCYSVILLFCCWIWMFYNFTFIKIAKGATIVRLWSFNVTLWPVKVFANLTCYTCCILNASGQFFKNSRKCTSQSPKSFTNRFHFVSFCAVSRRDEIFYVLHLFFARYPFFAPAGLKFRVIRRGFTLDVIVIVRLFCSQPADAGVNKKSNLHQTKFSHQEIQGLQGLQALKT